MGLTCHVTMYIYWLIFMYFFVYTLTDMGLICHVTMYIYWLIFMYFFVTDVCCKMWGVVWGGYDFVMWLMCDTRNIWVWRCMAVCCIRVSYNVYDWYNHRHLTHKTYVWHDSCVFTCAMTQVNTHMRWNDTSEHDSCVFTCASLKLICFSLVSFHLICVFTCVMAQVDTYVYSLVSFQRVETHMFLICYMASQQSYAPRHINESWSHISHMTSTYQWVMVTHKSHDVYISMSHGRT